MLPGKKDSTKVPFSKEKERKERDIPGKDKSKKNGMSTQQEKQDNPANIAPKTPPRNENQKNQSSEPGR